MADPITLIAIGGIVSGAAGVAGGISSISQSRAQAQTTRQIAELNAQTVLAEADIEETRLRRANERTIAQIRASIAGRGITVEGTPLDVLAGEVAQAEENVLLRRFEAERRVDVLRFTGGTEADFQRAAGLSTALGQFGTAGASILGGVGTLVELAES